MLNSHAHAYRNEEGDRNAFLYDTRENNTVPPINLVSTTRSTNLESATMYCLSGTDEVLAARMRLSDGASESDRMVVRLTTGKLFTVHRCTAKMSVTSEDRDTISHMINDDVCDDPFK